jgi:hypothetical protein
MTGQLDQAVAEREAEEALANAAPVDLAALLALGINRDDNAAPCLPAGWEPQNDE